jgi:protoporphyrinogen oxidase
MKKKVEIIIIGGGLSGLACAFECKKMKKDFILIEKSNRIGGKIGSIEENGYIYDIGFQVYNTNYSVTDSYLDLKKLQLSLFKPGASIYNGNSFKLFSDPFRDPLTIFQTLFSGLSTIKDKFKIVQLKYSLNGYSIAHDNSKEITSLEFLRGYGFSEKIIESFFKPFFSGIFLESKLETSSKFFKYVFSNFNKGYAALPKRGMQEIPRQIYDKLDKETIILNRRVTTITTNTATSEVVLDDKQSIEAKHVVVTGSLNKFYGDTKIFKFNSAKTVYFSTSNNIKNSNYINLFPYDGLINNIAVLSAISSSYSNNGDSLLSISIINSNFSKDELIPLIKSKLSHYYGGKDSQYTFLKLFDLKKATIDQNSGHFDKIIMDRNNTIFAGEYTTNGSIEGAIQSGKQAAKKIFTMRNKV